MKTYILNIKKPCMTFELIVHFMERKKNSSIIIAGIVKNISSSTSQKNS